ncbi:hypothetical protein HS041_18105 [Planomonospora sp. ID67723]|uniref:hypothetical protein n=1 Tax=Planomonospora sp. ID67723 TaxID=2738134 RepID=UPI0018C3F74C|nr:hypothetical protein [Planomonospora sp. ID67723]MBG0829681.1 hypothetical protein [Planomonospora sp. ID67723]
MSAEGVEHALRVRREERDRISGDVLDLEAHTVFRLLRSSPLRGESARRWEEIRGRVALLWALLDAYRSVLARAGEVWDRRRRPGPAELAELTGLLTEAAVRLVPEAGPVERRSLLGTGEQRFTLDEAVAAMDLAFRDITGVITDVDAVWSTVLPRLDDAAAAAGAARGLLRELGEGGDGSGGDSGLEACEREIERIREELRHDPLGDGGRDVDRVAEAADRLHERLRRAAALRRAYGERRTAAERRLGRVAAAEEESRLVRDLVLVKIASPALPVLGDSAPLLRERLAALDGLGAAGDAGAAGGGNGEAAPGGGGGRWLERAELLAEVERGAEEALRRAEQATAALRELMARRDELRGRLEAFRAKAVRLGRAEDAETARLYRHAHDLLWTAPCDLRRATVAVTGYQRATEGATG